MYNMGSYITVIYSTVGKVRVQYIVPGTSTVLDILIILIYIIPGTVLVLVLIILISSSLRDTSYIIYEVLLTEKRDHRSREIVKYLTLP